jgi:RNA polymerase sigma factor (sigma-70 family)
MEPQNALAYRREPLLAALRLASDAHLVEQVHAGSERAFEALFDRYQTALLQFCARMLGSLPEAEDAVQLTFMAAYRDLMQAKRPAALRPWLYAIARHRCLNVLRARRERALANVPEVAVDYLASEVATRDDLRAILADLATLPRDQRHALVLAELGDISHEEIAQLLGCPQKRVKALVFQARSSLAAARSARETPCTQIREQLASLHGAALRRALLRRHLSECPGCRAFRDELRAERRQRGVLLPVAVGLKRTILGPLVGSGGEAGSALVSTGGLAVGRLAATALAAIVIPAGGIVVLSEMQRPPASATHNAPLVGAPVTTARSMVVPYDLGALPPGAALGEPHVPTTAIPGSAPGTHAGQTSSLGVTGPAQVAPTTPGDAEQAAPTTNFPRAPIASQETVATDPAPAPSEPRRPAPLAVPVTTALAAPATSPANAAPSPVSAAQQAAATLPSAAPARPSVADQPGEAPASAGLTHGGVDEQGAPAQPSPRAQRPTADEPGATVQPSTRAQRPTDPAQPDAARANAHAGQPAAPAQPDPARANAHAGQPADPAQPDPARANAHAERRADTSPVPPRGAPQRNAAGLNAQPTRPARDEDRSAARGEAPATTPARAVEPNEPTEVPAHAPRNGNRERSSNAERHAGPTAVDQGAPVRSPSDSGSDRPAPTRSPSDSGSDRPAPARSPSDSGSDRPATADDGAEAKSTDGPRAPEPQPRRSTPDADTSKRPH